MSPDVDPKGIALPEGLTPGSGSPGGGPPPEPDYGRETVEALRKEFGGAITGADEFRGESCVEIALERLHDAAVFLKTSMGYLMLSSMAGVDHYPDEPRFRVVYMLTHMEKRNQFRFQVRLDGEKPEVPTVCDVWQVANWQEREVYDFFGIRFLNHPDLRRVLMSEDFEGYPLRKDYPLLGIDVGLKARS